MRSTAAANERRKEFSAEILRLRTETLSDEDEHKSNDLCVSEGWFRVILNNLANGEDN